MSSPIKLEKKQVLKNELDKISSSSLRRSNSISVVTSQTKSLSQGQDNNRDSSRLSQILFATSLDNTNDKKVSTSPHKRVGKSSNKKPNGKKLTFKKKFAETINIQSYKKYNVDLSYNDPNYSNESSKCRCQIF